MKTFNSYELINAPGRRGRLLILTRLESWFNSKREYHKVITKTKPREGCYHGAN